MLGEFEYLILTVAATLDEDAYGAAIDTAIDSCRALYGLTDGSRHKAPHSHIFPSPIKPKKSVTPSARSDCAIAS